MTDLPPARATRSSRPRCASGALLLVLLALACTGGARAAEADAPASASAPASTPARAADEVVLEPFPGATQVGRYVNGRERGNLPISVPDRSEFNEDRISHVVLPYDGRVVATQYKHGADESPLLIERHYAEQLAAQGFTVLTICETPCRTPRGLEDTNAAWLRELDPMHQLGLRGFGDRGSYFLAYRRNAVVAVRIGSWDLAYGSTVKIVQADAIDLGPIERYVAGQRAAAAAPAASQPASAAAAATTTKARGATSRPKRRDATN